MSFPRRRESRIFFMAINYKKFIKAIAKVLIIFIVAAVAVVFIERYFLPRLSASQFFSKYKFLQKASENVTIINKTEQVTVKEDDSINTIASQAIPAVVNIISINEQKQISSENLLRSQSSTGVLVTNDGLIATYRTAIIEKEARYKVLLFDGTTHDAKLLGIDEFTNLAYLKIKVSNLPSVSFADSSDFRAGKKLIAIGNSSGEYQNRFTAGLLSNINKIFNIAGKTISSSEKLEGVFETDFDNQPAYEGGPVINYNGELGGIMGSAVIDNQKHFFQIPSSVIRKSMELAIKGELNARPTFGAYYLPITREHALANDLARDRGALIFSSSGKQSLAIIAGSPAEKSGLRINDIIIAINNQEVNLDNPLSNLLSQYKKGDEIELLIIREGKEMKIKVGL